MALNKQTLAIDLGMGLDTKTDPKRVVPGKLLTLENCVFTKNMALSKKPGNRKFPGKTLAGTALTSGDSLATFEDELLQYQNQNLYSYSSGGSAWIDKGAVTSAIVSTKQIIKNTATQSQCDSAGNEGISVYAWEDTRGGVRCSVYDEVSGTPMLVDTVVDASGSRARCIAFREYLYVFYYKSGSLYARRVNPLSPTILENAVELSTTVNTSNPTYDVYAYSDLRILFVHNVQGASEIKLAWVDIDLAVYSGTLAPQTIAEAGTNCLGIIPGPNNTFYVAYQNGTDGVRCTIRNNGGGQVVAPLTVENITASNVVNITGHLTSSTSVTIYYEVTAAATYNRKVRYNTVSSTGTAGTAADFMRSVGLSHKAFTYTDADSNAFYYVGLVHDSVLQATYFTARSDGSIVAKQQPYNAGGVTTRPILANVWGGSTKFTWSILNKTQIVSENATIFTPTGVSATSLDFASSDVFTSAELGGTLLIAGGILSMYDGQGVVEHGFHIYPENVTATPQTTGGSLADGAYQVCAVYEWTDNKGLIHRSAPSIPVTATVSGGGGSGSIDVVVPSLRVTAKKSPRSNVSIVGYVTEASGTIFYRYTSITSPTLNDPTADTVTLPDVTAVSLSNEILYTVGGVLENIAPPACAVLEVFKNRVFLGGLEDSTSFWFSKENKQGVPVEFAAENLKKIEPNGGPLKAFGVLDDKLVLFKKDRYYYTYGDGPNNAGLDGDFAEPIFVTADIGCTVASSISRTPVGLMLKCAKGIYLVDSTLNPSYVGADVERYNSYTITSGVLVQDINQVRFTTLDGYTLVYDYYQKQWGTFSGVAAKDAVNWQNQYVFLRSNGSVYYDVDGYFKDEVSPIRMKIGTGWISLAGVAGFQRMYKIQLVGEYKSPHKLKVSVGYDFSDAYTQVAYLDPQVLLPIETYGDDSPYGESGTVYGGTNESFRFIINLKQQKCQAIRFLIEEQTTSATDGSQEAFTLTAIGLSVGIKTGFSKLKNSLNVATRG